MEVLLGAWREALRADKAVVELLRIRRELELEFYDHITAVLREIESTSRLLRDLYDLFPIYRSRVPIIIYYLDIILPSLERTIKNMSRCILGYCRSSLPKIFAIRVVLTFHCCSGVY